MINTATVLVQIGGKVAVVTIVEWKLRFLAGTVVTNTNGPNTIL